MPKIHIADSSIGEITWEPPLKAQELLLSLPDDTQTFVISELERYMRVFCSTVLSGLFSTPYVGSLLLDNLDSILRDHNQQAMVLLTHLRDSIHP